MKNNLSIISENIKRIKTRKNSVETAEKYWISLAVRELLCDGIDDPREIARILKQAFAASIGEKLGIAREILKNIPIEFHQDLTDEVQMKKELSVSNFSGSLSDGAVLKFFGNEEFTHIKRDAYIDIFEDVYNDRTSYCIVPIENSSTGKLLNFYSMIANYNLKIDSVCDIEHPGQDSVTRFGLLTKAPIYLSKAQKNKKYIELSLSISRDYDISGVLIAASECGLTPVRVDSIQYAHITSEYSYYVVFKLERNASLKEFLLYLILEGITYTPIGIFSAVE